MDKVIAAIRAAADRQRAELFELLSIPSISADPAHKPDVQRAAQWLLAKLQGMGIRSEVVPTPGHGIVYGEHLATEGAPTVLLYGHYDVQPVDPLNLWTTPPFEPTIRDGKVFARGSSDDKGQVLCHLLAIEAFMEATGGLPVNLKIVIEGEEEVGSPNLTPFVEASRERLACDAVMVSDSAFFAKGVPSIVYGLRGLAYMEVIAHGPNRDLHSGSYGGAVANPADALAGMIAALHDEDRRIAVPGFYDKVRQLTPAEREEYTRLPHDEEAYMADLGVDGLQGEAGFSTLERLSARPTLEVNGIWGGYMGEGAKTVLPAYAGAKISCRLVPDQDPDDIAARVEKRLRELAPAGIRLEFVRHHGGRPYLAAPDSPFVEAGKGALEAAFGKRPVMTREGGSIPVVEAFGRLLGAPAVLMGLGLPDDNLHSPNEKLDLEQFHKGIEAAAQFMALAGKVGR
ncbi:MAG: dipeptidase [Candidatus Latescibacteria bacterium]|nr:dipeptidase [bacterium]MCB9515745.1 dipeptidase [Candidatus Latescibacterota bacterium]